MSYLKMPNDFADAAIEEILKNTKETLLVKAKEYARNGDRMHNFNQGSILENKLRERVIQDFRLKHLISRNDLINDLEKEILPSIEVVNEKYGDIINYFILEQISILQKIEEKTR